ANALTRATAVLAALFFVTSLALTLMATYGRGPRSNHDGTAPATAPARQTAPAGQRGNDLEQLQRMQGEQPATPAPGSPATGGAPAIPFQAPSTPTAPTVPQSQ
ncbi:MAG: preprotein translocase subunit SecG, partial [Microvirga sp.]